MRAINQARKLPHVFHHFSKARAARRCAELHELNPKWPQARVRKAVAREMGVRTWVVRYLLRRV
jgi:hypothetical protein